MQARIKGSSKICFELWTICLTIASLESMFLSTTWWEYAQNIARLTSDGGSFLVRVRSAAAAAAEGLKERMIQHP